MKNPYPEERGDDRGERVNARWWTTVIGDPVTVVVIDRPYKLVEFVPMAEPQEDYGFP